MNPYASLSTPDLFERREAMEIEMRAISARLSAPDAPGLRGRLVDAEGFPIAGCDLYAVRADRGRYDALRNDHAEITAEVESRIAGHMSERANETGAVKTTSETATKMKTDAAQSGAAAAAGAERGGGGRAFAVIDEIVSGCPGEMDGLRVGDRVCAVGDVRWGFEDPSSTPPPEAMADAARTFAANENRVVRVVVLRRGERQVVEVTPRAWSGRGLVGVHMRSV